MSDKMLNIHDYLEAIGAEPPSVDEQSLSEAKRNMIMCDSIEEAVATIVLLDEADEIDAKVKEGK